MIFIYKNIYKSTPRRLTVGRVVIFLLFLSY